MSEFVPCTWQNVTACKMPVIHNAKEERTDGWSRMSFYILVWCLEFRDYLHRYYMTYVIWPQKIKFKNMIIILYNSRLYLYLITCALVPRTPFEYIFCLQGDFLRHQGFQGCFFCEAKFTPSLKVSVFLFVQAHSGPSQPAAHLE